MEHHRRVYGSLSNREGALLKNRMGVWFGIGAYVLWGLTPLYWNLVSVPAATLVASRIVWALPVLAVILTVKQLWRSVVTSYANWRSVLLTVAAASLLLVNWTVFLWAVTNDRIVDVSFGYFINPLVSVALGVVILRERLRPMQWMAVGIAVIAVVGMGLDSGVPPWIGLIVAFSFGFYGLLKKQAATPAPIVSLFGETSTMFIPAALMLVFLTEQGTNQIGTSPGVTIFLVSAGLASVVPLLLFGASAKLIPLSMLGFLQYIAPSIQLLLAVIVFNESVDVAQLRGFAGVWIALAVFTYDVIRDGRRQRLVAARA